MSGYLTGYNWSQEEHDILVEMLDNGMNIREIENSGKLNRKYQNIWQYAKRHGLETNLSNRFCGMCDNSISDRPSQTLYCVECTLKRDWLKKKQEHNIQSRDNLWSVEEIEKMVYLNNKGLPDNKISSLVGRTKRAIEHKRAQLGIKSKYQIKPYKLTPEKVDEVIEYIESGLSRVEIAECTEINPTSVDKIAKENNLTIAKKKWFISCEGCDSPVSTTNSQTKFCSTCSKKRNNHQQYEKERRRYEKLRANGRVEHIPLDRLYERDGGVCYLCDKLCDFGDSRWQNNVFIVGENYPSRDHVIPIAKGGTHTWDNVMLAHHRCNMLKSDNLTHEVVFEQSELIPHPSI